MNLDNFKISKNWDMDISFKELIEYNKDCKIEIGAKHNFECYNGYLLYLSHPNKEEKYTIELGITEDGFVYEGDYGCCDDCPTIPIEEGLKILNKYRDVVILKDDLEMILLKNNLN